MKKTGQIFTPKTNRLLYILLLIATPFLLLQNYLQSAIGKLSNLTWNLGEAEIPVTLTILIVLLIPVTLATYRKINITRILGWVTILLLFFIGQRSTDYYFNHKFYELQYNWHYFAYSIFAYINFRALKLKNSSDQKIILSTFLAALATSTIDELLQMPLSNRIFDVGDISKDVWGAMIGLLFIYWILENGRIFKEYKFNDQVNIKDILNNPKTLLVTLFIGAYIFMITASVLTETQHLPAVILFTILFFLAAIVILHNLRKKGKRTLTISILVLLLLALTASLVINFNNNISYSKNNLLVYKGIPIYFFDVMILPDGSFRPVDKKTEFNQRDKNTIYSK
jgi:VanZ family protein